MSDFSDVVHACLLYEDANDKKAVVLPFIREGLENGEHCLFMTPEESICDWCLEFQAYGIDVKQEQESGMLTFVAQEDWRGEGRFSSLVKARELWTAIQPRLGEYPGVRIMGDAEWVGLDPALGADQVCHWEATADLLYQGESVKTICMYDLTQHPPAEVRAALRTHAMVLFKSRQYVNPHYEASRILEHEPHLNESAADRELVRQMLADLELVQVC